MSTFITRVELHHATEADYERLHSAMAQQGYARTIMSDDGRRYRLPWAEYCAVANWTLEEARTAAANAAASTGRSFAVLTSLTNGVAWQGLSLAA
jgi:hypothetical protein